MNKTIHFLTSLRCPCLTRHKLPAFVIPLFLQFSLALAMGSSAWADVGDVKTGGWIGAMFSDSNGSGPYHRPAFDVGPWDAWLKAEPAEDWKVLAEVESLHGLQVTPTSGMHMAGHAAGITGQLMLVRLYLERNFSQHLNIRAGKFFLPMGYYNDTQWSFLTETVSRPYSFDNMYFHRMSVGVQALGKHYFGDSTSVRYFAWINDGPDVTGTDSRTVSKMGYGGSTFIKHELANGMSFGVTAGYHAQWRNPMVMEQHDEGGATDMAANTDPNSNSGMDMGGMGGDTMPMDAAASMDGSDKEQNIVTGIDLKLTYLDLRYERYMHKRSKSTDLNTQYFTATAWPLIAMDIDNVGITYRRDQGDDLKNIAMTAMKRSSTSHSTGFLWRPTPVVLIKGEYRVTKHDDQMLEDVKAWNLFWAVKY